MTAPARQSFVGATPIFKSSSPAFRRDAPGNLFTRLLTARVLADVFRVPIARVVETRWPSDRVLEEIVARAAVAPAMTSVAGWAAELAVRTVYDALDALGPASACVEIFRRALLLDFAGAGSISAPGFVANYQTTGGFVAEGNPIPIPALSATPTILSPHKVAAIAVLTREMVESSNAEALITDAIVRVAGRMIDEVLFDANPGDAARPPGLRSGVSALTPSNQSDPSYAALEDITALLNSLAPVAGNGPYILVASPGRAVLLGRHFPTGLGVTVIVLGSSAVVNDVLAIAPTALVAALSPTPAIETSKAAQIVMDTAPGAANVAGGSINKSMFQSDALAVKVRWPVTWALRDPRGFAWMTPTWKLA